MKPRNHRHSIVWAALALLLTGCEPAKDKTPARNTPASQQARTEEAPGPADHSKHVSLAELAALRNGKTVVMLSERTSEQDVEAKMTSESRQFVPDFRVKIVFVDNLPEGQLMLRSGKADFILVADFTGDFLARRNTDLQLYKADAWQTSTQMVFANGHAAEFEKVNDAFREMMKDGSVERLVARWITELPVGEEPSAAPMPVINGAGTIRIGISGDAPPLDYIAADGKPGGFNVALLGELSQRANLNIELITVTSGTRFTALQSGLIDAFLWDIRGQAGDSQDAASPATQSSDSGRVVLTESYLNSNWSMLGLR